MPRCDCGFDFVKTRPNGQPLTSYALLPHNGYRAAIRREHAIVVEKNREKKSRLIADAASSVGALVLCPKCGAWLLAQPLKQGRKPYAILRKLPRPQPTSRGTE